MSVLSKLFGNEDFQANFFGGLAEQVELKRKRATERAERMADYAIEKNVKEQERYTKELDENLDKVKEIAGRAGSVDGAEYLIQTYGMEGALEKAQQYETLRGYGVVPQFDNQGSVNTHEELAQFVTRAPDVFSGKSYTKTREGILGKLGIVKDPAEQAQKLIDESAEVFGFGKERPSIDLGAVPTMVGVDESDFGMLANAEDEAVRQIRLAQAAGDVGDVEKQKKHMGKATAMIDAYRMITAKGSLTISQTQTSMKRFKSTITEVSGIGGSYQTDASGTYMIPDGKVTQNLADITNAAGAITSFYQNALESGIQSGQVLAGVDSAITQNLMPVITVDSEGNKKVEAGTVPLIPNGLVGGTNAFALKQADKPNDTPETTEEAPEGSVQEKIDALKEQLKDPQLSQSMRNAIQAEILELERQSNNG